MATEKQWKQGRGEDERESVRETAIKDTTEYPLVQDFARLSVKRGMVRTRGKFDQAMKFAGIGGSTTEKNEQAERREREGKQFSGR